ncbi:MAG: hypothetical protein HZB26_17890 [Candidatus Hydrogenedentes bacterium]|nr:hypothetical protein [Candidatus Hydrogenedentota bacterium]
MRRFTWLVTMFTALPAAAFADAASRSNDIVQTGGASGIWILANVSYAGMRAQSNPSVGWRILSFIFGFPGTLVSFLVIREGSERAYGIDLPKKPF